MSATPPESGHNVASVPLAAPGADPSSLASSRLPRTAAMPIAGAFRMSNSDDDGCSDESTPEDNSASVDDFDLALGDENNVDEDDSGSEYSDAAGSFRSRCSLSYLGASPGAGSYVSAPDSWRGMPPPMLATSFDSRYRPNLRPPPQAPRAKHRTPHGVNASAAAETNRQHPHRASAAPGEDPGRTSASTVGMPASPSCALPPMAPKPSPAVVALFIQQTQGPRDYNAVASSSNYRRSVPWRVKLAKMSVQWGLLIKAPRELWIIFCLKFLSSYAYFALALILTIYLTQEFGLSDTSAGWAYGMYGVMSTIMGFLCGWVIDYLGVRKSLIIGGVVGAASRFILALTPSHRTAQFMLYTALPFSECLGIPIMTIGIKRYTNSHNRTFAFSIFYSMMNLAALTVGPLVDYSRRSFREGIVIDLHTVGFEAIFQLSALRIIVFSSALASGAMLLGVMAGIREIEVDDQGNITSFEPNRDDSPWTQTFKVLREPAFWRLTVFTLLIVGVRLVFRHLDATMPKYLTRQFGPEAPFGLIYAINPFLVILLVPLIGLFTRKVDSYSMILWGSWLSALSPFWICIAPRFWTVIMFMVTLSVGEAIYSPRVYEYTMEVSGRGVEGLYSSLSSAPLFSVKLLVGGMSGWLLASFMPANDVTGGNGGVLWAIIGLTSVTSPVLMMLLRSYISPPSEKHARCTKRTISASSYAAVSVTDAVTEFPERLVDDSTPLLSARHPLKLPLSSSNTHGTE
jgi:proton-dependent oligopeptide transporter, POT family